MRNPHNERLSSDIHRRPEPERKCILSGEHGARDALIRLAISPDGDVLPDVKRVRPGAARGSAFRAQTLKSRSPRAN